MFCTCTRSCARADDAKIVRSRDRNAILRNYLNDNSLLNFLELLERFGECSGNGLV